jgi:small subunit ribosomal protein S17
MAKKQQQGTIVSNKMQKTVVVRVERMEQDKKYKKRYKVQKKFKAHTGEQSYNVGDVVIVEECRPLSKDKNWKVIKKIADSKSVDAEPIENI